MIRAGRFYAVLIADGYEVRDDVHGLVSAVHLPEASRGQIRRDASADVAARHHQHQANMRAAETAQAMEDNSPMETRPS